MISIRSRWLIGSIVLVLGLVFIYAGVIKTFDVVAFYKQIRLYHLVSDEGAWLVAHFLPWFEIIGGLGLFWKESRVAAAFLTTLLLLTYAAAIIFVWKLGLHIDCGCFGGTGMAPHYPWNYVWVLIRDAVMASGAVYVLVFSTLRVKT